MTEKKDSFILNPSADGFKRPPKFEDKAHQLIKPGMESVNQSQSQVVQTQPGWRPGEVAVTLFQNPDKTYFVVVELHSTQRRGLRSRRTIDFAGKNIETVAGEVMYTAGALAEYQAGQFNDKHDVKDVVKLAGESFKEMMAEVNSKH